MNNDEEIRKYRRKLFLLAFFSGAIMSFVVSMASFLISRI